MIYGDTVSSLNSPAQILRSFGIGVLNPNAKRVLVNEIKC